MTREEIDGYLDNVKIRLTQGDLDGAILQLKTAVGAVGIFKRELAKGPNVGIRFPGIQGDVLDALCGLGADRTTAAAAIKCVVAGSTGLGFELLFRKALEMWRQQESQGGPSAVGTDPP